MIINEPNRKKTIVHLLPVKEAGDLSTCKINENSSERTEWIQLEVFAPLIQKLILWMHFHTKTC
jgi:hypothetical protein